MERDKLSSRLGFILLSAGCAIGIGNVWKFPYMVGQYGGGAFVLVYLFFLLVMGVPALTMEFSIGRASQKSPAKMYNVLEKPGQVWHIHGKVSIVGFYLLMMFYTTVAGWMIQYFVKLAAGDFEGLDANGISGAFDNMLKNPVSMIFYMTIAVAIGVIVCSLGVANGLEKITKVMMIALLCIMVVLAVNSMFMDGGRAGIEFYLRPDFKKMMDIGIGKVIVAAMNQAFFTLSIGIGSMAIFGSYIDKKRTLMGEAVNVAVLDTFVALVSGLIIFPACFAYGVQPDSGPSLVFITLPNIFNNILLGRLWGSLFFVFMSFAAISTVLAVFEGIVASTMDMFNWNRKKACVINGMLLWVLSVPCSLGFNLLSGIAPLGEGTTIMDFEDFLVSNIILPLGALVVVLFCTTKKGWGFDRFMAEANEGKGLKLAKWMKPYVSYVIPVMILIIFIMGLI